MTVHAPSHGAPPDPIGAGDAADRPIALRPARREEAEAVSALVNSAYRGDSSRAGWTTEADLLGGQRTDPAALREFMVVGETALDRVLLVHDGAAGETGLGRLPEACVQLERRGGDAYLGMLTVQPTRQASGLGKRLLDAAECWAAAHWGARAIIMTVITQRPELIAWYERRGYSATGETAPFPYGDTRFGEPKRPDLQFIVLRKPLGG
ncbi:MAG: GNAT family N-acetyltransferase [Xanthomonadales bacterium]|nr:GNAT family N-acetyltransferase [Xanthomonadales bacterium]